MGFFNSGINTGPGVIMFAPNPMGSAVNAEGQMMSSWMLSLVLTAVVSSLLSFAVAYYIMIGGGKYTKGGYRSVPGASGGSGLGSLREACSNSDTTATISSTASSTYHHNYPWKNTSSSSPKIKTNNVSSTELATMVSGAVASKSEYLSLDI